MSEVKNRDRHRWGIIYMPMIGALSPMKRWNLIREYLDEKGVAYDFFCADAIIGHINIIATAILKIDFISISV